MMGGMRLFLNVDGEALRRLQKRAWTQDPRVPLRVMAKQLLEDKLEEEERKEALLVTNEQSAA
jgi:hypothetical protein